MYKSQMAGKKKRHQSRENITDISRPSDLRWRDYQQTYGGTREKTGFQDITENSKEQNTISECKEIVSEMNQVLIKQKSLE